MTFPNVAEALADWDLSVQFAIVKKTPVDFEAEETNVDIITFRVVLEPIKPRELLVKPEGQRKWKWYTLWSGVELQIDDIVQDPRGAQYRVMAQSDWSQAGYFQYEITQEPK